MTRMLGMAIVFALVVLIGATLVGRAIDVEVSDRVILTRDGHTLDCERVVRGHGHVFYENCVRVP